MQFGVRLLLDNITIILITTCANSRSQLKPSDVLNLILSVKLKDIIMTCEFDEAFFPIDKHIVIFTVGFYLNVALD
jgi:hypothetical protein